MNYFEFFEIPVSFYPDETALKKRFLRNSKKYHPDFYTLESEEKQAEVLELSTMNNQAYKTLSSFDARLAYILKLKGELKEEGGGNEIPQDFLMEVMDINEVLMELEFDFDAKIFAETLEKIELLENELVEEIEPVLKAYNSDSNDPNSLKKAKDFYLKKRYLLRIHENLNKFAPASKEA